MRQVILHPGEDGYWVVECLNLPGCISQGKTREEALDNIREAIRAYEESLRLDGVPVPEENDGTNWWRCDAAAGHFRAPVRCRSWRRRGSGS